MKDLKNSLKKAFYNAQIVLDTTAAYAGAALGVLTGETPAGLFALQYGTLKADQARLKKQSL